MLLWLGIRTQQAGTSLSFGYLGGWPGGPTQPLMSWVFVQCERGLRKTPIIVPHPQPKLQKRRPFLRGFIWVTLNLIPPSEEIDSGGSLITNVADVGKSMCGGALGVPSVGLGFSQPGYMCFVGFEIAFDGVTQGFPWGRGIPWHGPCITSGKACRQ